MRKLTLAAALAVALAAAGIAVARGVDGSQSAKAVSASFTATTAGASDTHTCTSAAGKTFASSKATYKGTASGSPDLTGPVTIDARSSIDTTDGIGVVSGTIRIAASAGRTEAHFSAVYDHGSVAGTATGHGATPHVQLLANVSAGFSAAGGFTGGRIGGGTSGGSAVELSGRGCGPPPPTEHAGVKTVDGPIKAVTPASITVGGLTCAVPDTSLRVDVAFQYSVGDRVKITCSLASGAWTLVKIEKKR